MKTSKNLLVSFSGGETSAFMAQWLNNHYEDYGYENIVFVFANTGLENEATLEFIEQCDKHFQLNVQWIEAKVNPDHGMATTYYMTDYIHASRKGEVFEALIHKYGIPNQANPNCTRELKLAPIKAFGKQWFNGEKYDTAIGIRKDEMDRINEHYKKRKLIYPLVQADMIPSTKPMINFYWKSMPFRLNLKGYQGNCITCWKKSFKKLYQIAKEKPESFDFMDRMEQKYGNFFPQQRIEKRMREGKEIPNNITFFRNHTSAQQIVKDAQNWSGIIKNDAEEYNYQLDLLLDESCEVWSECGIDKGVDE